MDNNALLKKDKLIEEKQKKTNEVPQLTKEDLRLISQVLYNNRWSGEEWQRVIIPLINKIGKIADSQLDKPL